MDLFLLKSTSEWKQTSGKTFECCIFKINVRRRLSGARNSMHQIQIIFLDLSRIKPAFNLKTTHSRLVTSLWRQHFLELFIFYYKTDTQQTASTPSVLLRLSSSFSGCFLLLPECCLAAEEEQNSVFIQTLFAHLNPVGFLHIKAEYLTVTRRVPTSVLRWYCSNGS